MPATSTHHAWTRFLIVVELERMLCDMTKENNDLAERISVATGLNNRIESEMKEARACVLQATAAASTAETTAA